MISLNHAEQEAIEWIEPAYGELFIKYTVAIKVSEMP